MEGWKLKSGLLDDSYLEKEKIACLINGFLFSDQYKTSTYKYALFKVILDNIFTLNRFSVKISLKEKLKYYSRIEEVSLFWQMRLKQEKTVPDAHVCITVIQWLHGRRDRLKISTFS